MIPSFSRPTSAGSGGSSGGADSLLFRQYKLQLRNKEKHAARTERDARAAAAALAGGSASGPSSAAASAAVSPVAARSVSTSASALHTPQRSYRATASSSVSAMTSPLHSLPVTFSDAMYPLTPSQAAASGRSTPAGVRSPSSGRATPLIGASIAPASRGAAFASVSKPRPPRLTQEEVNVRWKAVFAELERWTADEKQWVASAASKPALAHTGYVQPRCPCSLATAALAHQRYERALDQHAQVLEGHAIQVSQWHRLADAAHAQAAAGGPHGLERRLAVPPSVGPPPPPPPPPPVSPYAPAFQTADDKAWRAELAAHPEALRGDALDHRALEGRLTAFLSREGSPLTRVKDAFVENFLNAYSAQRNVSLRSASTSEASDLLLSNTLPTLLYFLELVGQVLSRLFPQLEIDKGNRDAAESVRQACMEAVFPHIFPALFALYKRKYYFADAELSAKMSVLSSAQSHLQLADLGVSKWFQLDEQLIEQERKAAKEKKRRKERERMAREHGETEAQATAREGREDAKALAAERIAAEKYDRRIAAEQAAIQAEADAIMQAQEKADMQAQEQQQKATDTSGTFSISAALAAAAPPATAATDGSRLLSSADVVDGEHLVLPPASSSISIQLQPPEGSSGGGGAGSSSGKVTPLAHSPAATAAMGLYSSRGASPLRSPGSSATSGARAIPTTRITSLEAGNHATVTAKSLSSSPRAEKLQDVFLSMSPARRAGANAAAAALSSSPLSKAAAGLPHMGSSQQHLHPDSAANARPASNALSTKHSLASVPCTDAVVVSHRVDAAGVVFLSINAAADVVAAAALAANSLPISTDPPAAANNAQQRVMQVGFAASAGSTAAAAPSPAAAALPSSPAPAGSSSLAQALHARRAAAALAAASPAQPPASTTVFPAFGSGSAVAASTEPKQQQHPSAPSSALQTPPRTRPVKLGLGGATAALENSSDDFAAPSFNGDASDSSGDSSDDEELRMPTMRGDMPKLGSSLPMLQGLPSSMLTHTPGSGQALLRQEMERKRALGANSPAVDQQQAMANGGGGGMHSRALSSSLHSSSQLQQQLSSFSAQAFSSGSAAATPATATPSLPNSSPSQPNIGTRGELIHLPGLPSQQVVEAAEEIVQEEYPYQEAVVLLRCLSSERTPRDKLATLIAVSQEVCYCVDRFYARACFARGGWRPRAEDLCIAADDLLSIVSFILLKAQLPFLCSEAAFIDDFISRGMKLHMPGYFLATLQAAIELIQKLDKTKFLTKEQQSNMQEMQQKDANGRAPSGSISSPGATTPAAATMTATTTPAATTAQLTPESNPSTTPPSAGSLASSLTSSASSQSLLNSRSKSSPQAISNASTASRSQQPIPRRGPLGQLIMPTAPVAAPAAAVGSHTRSQSNTVVHTPPSTAPVAASLASAPSSRAPGSNAGRSQPLSAHPPPALRIGNGMGLGISPSTPPPLSSALPRPPKPTAAVPASAAAAGTIDSSPSQRLGSAEPEAAFGLQFSSQPLSLNLEHFSQPSTPLSGSTASSRSTSFISLPVGYFDDGSSADGGGANGRAVVHSPAAIALIEKQRAAAAAAQAAQVAAQHRAAVALVEKQRRERRIAQAAAAAANGGSLPVGSRNSPRSLSSALGSLSTSNNQPNSLAQAVSSPRML